MDAPQSSSPSPSAQPVELASILFLDIVGYSLLPMDQQSAAITRLQQIVRGTEQFAAASARQTLLSLPTGDGMAIVFFQDLVAPVECAIAITQEVRDAPTFGLRMGIHSGPVYRHADIRDELNVVGGGINIAQRVMDSGDDGHILLSQSVADVLRQLGPWQDRLHDLGECAVKHGVIVHIYNLYTGDAGNPATPSKLRAQRSKSRQSTFRKVFVHLAPAVVFTFLIRVYFNTSPVTRDRPLGGAETFVVFLVLLAATAVILWLKRFTQERIRK